MEEQPKHFISIWLFIGILLLIYGILIVAAGIYDYNRPTTVLAGLHAQLWWGALLVILGAVYTWVFRPKKDQ